MDTFTGMETQLNGTRADRNAEVVRHDQEWARKAVRRYADTTSDPDFVAEELHDILGLREGE